MIPQNIKTISRLLTFIMLIVLLSGRETPTLAAPGDITRVSVDSAGAQPNGGSLKPAISDDGRFVAFVSGASNLVSGDTNNAEDIFVKDRQTGVTTRVSVRSNGTEANGMSTSPAISADGRFVAFYSDASNLLNGDSNGFGDIFVHDRQTGETRRVSVDSSGAEANAPPSDDYYVVSISGDGRFVAYYSDASNLVSGDINGVSDIFVYDRQNGRTTRASVASNGSEANGSSRYPNLSSDGRYVTFASGATNLVAGDANGKTDVFVRDLQTGSTTLVSISTSGAQADGGGNNPDISGDGRYVVFMSNSGNLDPRADEYRKELVYVHDRQVGQTTLATVFSDGGIMEVGLSDQPTISRDGRYVAFSFYQKGDNNGILHVWVRDLQTGQSTKVEGGDGSGYSSLSADGKFVAFNSGSSNLVSGDTNGVSDVFVREVAYGPERNPTVASVTPDCGYSTPVCTYPTAASVPFIVIFSEQVSGVTADDFSLEMLEGITGASITGVSGYGVQYFVTVNTGTGDGRLRLNVVDNDSIIDTVLNPLGGVGAGNGNFTGKKYMIDKFFPTVTSIVRADPNPAAAGTVRFTVTFSEVVYPVMSDDFVLTTTGSISGATITAIDPIAESAIYTVTVDTGIGDGTLRLDLIDDDSISDNFIGPIGGMPLGGVGIGNGNFTTGETYTIGAGAPGIPSVTGSLRADANPSGAANVNFAVTFSEAVSGVDPGDFSLTTTGSISGALVTNVSGSGNTYTVIVGTGSGNGDLRLNVVDDDSILNASSSPLGGPGAGNGNFTTGEAYTINKTDNTPPIVTGILRTDANPTTASDVHFNVTFSEAVNGVDAGDFVLATTGSISGASINGLSGSANTYSITVATGSGNGTLRLDLIDNDSIVDSVNHPLGGLGSGNGNYTSGDSYIVDKAQTRLLSESLRSNGANDGWVLESSEDSGVGGSRNAVADTFVIGDDAQDRQYRAILHFPTHHLPDNAVVTQVILILKSQGVVGADPFATHQNITIDIRGGFFGSAGLFGINGLGVGDFQAPADKESVGTIINNPVSGWFWAMLDPSTYPYINLQGVTQLRLRFMVDDNEDMGNDYLSFYSGNYDQLAERPHLLVEYYLSR